MIIINTPSQLFTTIPHIFILSPKATGTLASYPGLRGLGTRLQAHMPLATKFTFIVCVL